MHAHSTQVQIHTQVKGQLKQLEHNSLFPSPGTRLFSFFLSLPLSLPLSINHPPPPSFFLLCEPFHRLDSKSVGEQTWTSSSLSPIFTLHILTNNNRDVVVCHQSKIIQSFDSDFQHLEMIRSLVRPHYSFRERCSSCFELTSNNSAYLLLVAALPSSVCQEGASDQSMDRLNIQKAPLSSSHIRDKSISYISSIFMQMERDVRE